MDPCGDIVGHSFEHWPWHSRLRWAACPVEPDSLLTAFATRTDAATLQLYITASECVVFVLQSAHTVSTISSASPPALHVRSVGYAIRGYHPCPARPRPKSQFQYINTGILHYSPRTILARGASRGTPFRRQQATRARVHLGRPPFCLTAQSRGTCGISIYSISSGQTL